MWYLPDHPAASHIMAQSPIHLREILIVTVDAYMW